MAANDRFATGMILPPPEIKAVIDKTATFIARSANPPQFEEKIREGQRSDPKFAFLNPADPYHAYYRDKTQRVMRGEVDDTENVQQADGQQHAKKDIEMVDLGLEPPQKVWTLDIPSISAIDLDIMKLTALFTARRGRSFLASLSAREARNYQFEFLHPGHSLFGYFNMLVDQYTRVLHPDKDTLEILKERSQPGQKWKTLELVRRYAKWERTKRENEKKREDEKEAERIAFQEIDWHDYAIVQTIEFTAADANAELPPPMSVAEVENMTLAQKRMAAMIMENTADDVEALKVKQAEAEAAAAAGVQNGTVDVLMDVTADEADLMERRRREEAERAREIERAQALQASSTNVGGPMKIRNDYVPKVGGKNAKSAMSTCTICGQQIPIDELQEHMRIELLDPKWKSQRDALEARKAQSSELQSGANVATSLKRLAHTRTDIFGAEVDEERRKREEEEEKERRKEREKVVWDGHTATKAGTMDKFSTQVNFEEQIAAIHRAKGLGPQEVNAIGPGIGPSAVPAPLTSVGLPPPHASLPAPPVAVSSSPAPPAAGAQYPAATVSSGPQPSVPAPVMLPPLHYQPMDSNQPFGYQPPAAPNRQAALQAANQAIAGHTRSADEMMEGQVENEIPPAKRQKVMKMPGSQMYSEADWIGMHPAPISLYVQLPVDNTKPEWKLEGQRVTVPDLPLNLLVSTLRDRILQVTGSTLPASRIRLSYAGKMLTNSLTIGLYNMEDEESLELSVGAAKKR